MTLTQDIKGDITNKYKIIIPPTNRSQMKKAIFFPPSCSNIKFNGFESCRGEGRAVMNIAFGFTLLGYDSYIINNWDFKGREKPDKIWSYQNNNVFISDRPDNSMEYDIAFTYDSIYLLNSKNYKQKIVMTYEPSNIAKINEYVRSNNLENVTMVSSFGMIKNPNKNPFSLKYFPIIFPIPSINIGFLPYKFDPKDKKLKVYVWHSSWPGSAESSHNCCRPKQYLILDFLKSKGYKLELFIHIENAKYINRADLFPFNFSDNEIQIHYIENSKVQYDDIINLLQNVDICVSVGGLDVAGRSVLDMLSLGKPVIIVVDGININSDGIRFDVPNPLYKCIHNLIIQQESNKMALEKLERIFSDNNLEQSYQCYKNCFKDFDFNNWKEIVENFFTLIRQ